MSERERQAKADVFPATQATRIRTDLARGDEGRASLNHLIMITYAEPLMVYYRGTNARWLGDPDDIINGFFASRLARPDFMRKWHDSGLRLRRWLMNGLCFYLRELQRTHRDGARAGLAAEEEITFEGDPALEIDRAASMAFVREAWRHAAAECGQRGLEPHWDLFVLHHLEERTFRNLAVEFEVTPARAEVMARTAARRFRAALRDVLLRDGVPEQDVDGEIQSLLECTT